MSSIVIIGQLDVHADDSQAVSELMRVMMHESAKEQGCHHYAYSSDLETAHRFQLSELWESDAALAAHVATPHMAVYRAGMREMRVLKRTVRRYEVSGVKDL